MKMFLYFLTVAILIAGITSKPIVHRNVSDCSITPDGILYYQGKHSYSKFEHECLPWTDLQTIYPEIVNEANFFSDQSIADAKNYCRNPNMNVNGPWCFIADESEITMEQCGVCQSLTTKPTAPDHINEIESVTHISIVNPGFFQNLREKILQLLNLMKKKFNQFGAQISSYFKQ